MQVSHPPHWISSSLSFAQPSHHPYDCFNNHYETEKRWNKWIPFRWLLQDSVNFYQSFDFVLHFKLCTFRVLQLLFELFNKLRVDWFIWNLALYRSIMWRVFIESNSSYMFVCFSGISTELEESFVFFLLGIFIIHNHFHRFLMFLAPELFTLIEFAIHCFQFLLQLLHMLHMLSGDSWEVFFLLFRKFLISLWLHFEKSLLWNLHR